MLKYRITKKAIQDLSSIWTYTAAQWSQKQADKYYSNLTQAMSKLSDNPQRFGRHYPQISSDIYGYHIGHHIIFYKIIPSEPIIIVRILHEKMDLPNRILE